MLHYYWAANLKLAYFTERQGIPVKLKLGNARFQMRKGYANGSQSALTI